MNNIDEIKEALINVMTEVCEKQTLNVKIPKEVIPVTNEIVTVINAIEFYQYYAEDESIENIDDKISELFNYAEELFSRIIL